MFQQRTIGGFNLDFDIALELVISAKMLVALFLGAVIGFDRELHGSDAGIRTYAAVTIGSTLFTSVAAHIITDPTAESRIVANIVTGVGFLGAGIIYRDGKGSSRGLTTAATVWCSSAVGIAVGLNMFVIAIGATAVLYGLISLHHQKWYINWKQQLAKNHSRKDSENHENDGA